MSDAYDIPTPDGPLERPAAWNWAHVAVFILCWGPLNPLVLNVVRWTLMDSRGPTWDAQMTREFTRLMGASTAGPFAAAMEGRNQTACLAFGWRLLPWCTAALFIAAAVQTLWRPESWTARVIRQAIWGAACFVWFAAAFVSILNNSG